MTLAGDSIITPQPRCKTVDLDHPTEVDFAAKSTFIANAEEQNIGWENCWQVYINTSESDSIVLDYITLLSRGLWRAGLNSPL